MPQKSSRPFWFYRIYCLGFALIWNLVLGYRIIHHQPPGFEMLILVPFLLPAIFWIMSAAAFKWDYSLFGSLERTPPPDEPPLAVANNVGGDIGFCRATAPFVSWAVYPQGLSFSVWLMGTGYISFAEIKRIKPVFWGGCEIFHTNSEVRSPLVIPASNINAAIRERWSMPPECNI
jgi:hypothetical protein